MSRQKYKDGKPVLNAGGKKFFDKLLEIPKKNRLDSKAQGSQARELAVLVLLWEKAFIDDAFGEDQALKSQEAVDYAREILNKGEMT